MRVKILGFAMDFEPQRRRLQLKTDRQSEVLMFPSRPSRADDRREGWLKRKLRNTRRTAPIHGWKVSIGEACIK